MTVTKDTLGEEILKLPGVVTYFIMNGVTPFTCSGEYPCSLGKLLETRNLPDPDGFIAGLNRHLEQNPPA
jgi:hypothetical protein